MSEKVLILILLNLTLVWSACTIQTSSFPNPRREMGATQVASLLMFGGGYDISKKSFSNAVTAYNLNNQSWYDIGNLTLVNEVFWKPFFSA